MSKKSSQVEELPRCLKFLRNSSTNTIKQYKYIIEKYESFHHMSIEELVLEALDEQTNQVPPHLLKIIDRLEDYQEYLIEDGLVFNSIKEYMGKIKSIYHKNRVMIPYIEPINPKQIKRNEVIEYNDILTKEELKKALTFMRLPQQARLLVMAQGGLSNEECDHLTLDSFLNETFKYHQQADPIKALEWLSDENNPIIWVTKLIREKTKKPYYALISPEAVNKIASAKLYEKDLPSNSRVIPKKLLNQNKISFWRTCTNICKKLGMGSAGGHYRLRPHMLRKFHATYIRGSALTYEENSLISNAEIDEMQGRGKTSVQDTYIKTNPIKQKCLYAKVLNNLSLHHKYDYHLVDGDVLLSVHNDGDENIKLRDEVQDLRKKLKDKTKASEKVNALRSELGDDALMELIQGILNTS
ncbi:hypothetical protein [Methanobrevibacter sp.]